MSDTQQPCAAPLLEQLRTVPINRREMIEIESTHHRNIPYGRMIHDAADEIVRLRKLLDEVYTAMVVSGWVEAKDKLMQRVKAEAEKA